MKLRMLTLGMILASSVAVAQQAPHGSPGASEKHPYAVNMKDELGLTDEQVEKLREIRESGGSRADMQAVLTPEQRVKAAQMKQATKKGDRAARRARVQQELGLSDEQMDKMNEIKRNGGTREEMLAVMTPEQQAKFNAMRSKRSPHAPPQKPAATPATPATPATSTSAASPAAK